MTDVLSSQARPVQNAQKRQTQGQPRGAAFQTKATEVKRQRGRPKGSKNKQKSLLPTELASEILLKMRDVLPPDHYEYIRSVIKDGKAVSAQREAQIMLLLLGRNLIPVILEETVKNSDGDEEKYFRKDVTERLKVWNSVLNIVHQIEKTDDEGTPDKEKPILSVFERAGVDAGRLRILIGIESDSVGGSPNGTGRPEVTVRTVSDQLPERSLNLPDSEQEPTVRVLDPDSDRDDTFSSDEA